MCYSELHFNNLKFASSTSQSPPTGGIGYMTAAEHDSNRAVQQPYSQEDQISLCKLSSAHSTEWKLGPVFKSAILRPEI